MKSRTRVQTTRSAAGLVLLLAVAAPVGAESPREIARFLRVNQQALQDFSWTSRAELKVNGKTKGVQVFDVRYDMDGGLLKTQLDTDTPPAKRKAQLDPEMKALIDGYTHLTPVTLKKMFGQATIQRGVGDDASLMRVQAEGVRALGDRVDLWVDGATKRPRRSEVVTTFDGYEVRIETEFTDLDGGPSYPSRTTVRTRVKAKPAVLFIENFELTSHGG